MGFVGGLNMVVDASGECACEVLRVSVLCGTERRWWLGGGHPCLSSPWTLRSVIVDIGGPTAKRAPALSALTPLRARGFDVSVFETVRVNDQFTTSVQIIPDVVHDEST